MHRHQGKKLKPHHFFSLANYLPGFTGPNFTPALCFQFPVFNKLPCLYFYFPLHFAKLAFQFILRTGFHSFSFVEMAIKPRSCPAQPSATQWLWGKGPASLIQFLRMPCIEVRFGVQGDRATPLCKSADVERRFTPFWNTQMWREMRHIRWSADNLRFKPGARNGGSRRLPPQSTGCELTHPRRGTRTRPEARPPIKLQTEA